MQILGLNQYNALSLPDGSVVIAFGLLDQVQSDDELAFVLAHELGHIRLNHFAADVKAAKRQQTMSKLGQAFVVGAAVAGGVSSVSSGASALGRRRRGRLCRRPPRVGRRGHGPLPERRWSRPPGRAPTRTRPTPSASTWRWPTSTRPKPPRPRCSTSIQADADNRAAQTEALNAKIKEELGKAAGEAAIKAVYSGGFSGAGRPRQPAQGRRPASP